MFKISLSQVEHGMFFLLGLFTSMAILRVPLGFMTITPFNLMMYLLVVFEILYRNIKISQPNSYIYIGYLLCLSISSVYNYFSLPSSWGKANFTYLFNSFVLGYFLVFFGKDVAQIVKNDFLVGVKVNAWIQLVWGGLQYVLYKATGVSLNQIVFENLLHIQSSYLQSNVYRGVNRLTGLNWEPAYFGLTLIVGYVLSNRLWQKGLFVIGVTIAGSRTSLIALLTVILVELLYTFFSRKKVFKKRINQNGVVGIILLVLFATVIVANWNSLFIGINSTLSRFQDMTTDPSSKVHAMYYQQLGDLLFYKYGLFRSMFGIGPASSGYAYTLYYGLYEYFSSNPWNIENGVALLFVSSGIIGALCALLWFLVNLYINRDRKDVFALITGILIGGITYSYFVNWVWMITFFLSLPNQKTDFKEKGAM